MYRLLCTWPVCINSPVPATLLHPSLTGVVHLFHLLWKHCGIGMSPSSYVVWCSRPQTKAQDLKHYHNIRFY